MAGLFTKTLFCATIKKRPPLSIFKDEAAAFDESLI